MFRFDHRKDEQRRREKELLKEVKMTEKPKFKDLVAIMLHQYLIILPDNYRNNSICFSNKIIIKILGKLKLYE